MAKTATASTKPPLYFSVGQTVVAEDLREVAEQLNYSVCNAVPVYLSLITSNASWDTGVLGTHFIEITQASYTTVFEFDIFIDNDLDNINVEATCVQPAATTSNVRITVGGTASAFGTFSAGATSTATDQLTTGSTGTGWQRCLIEVQRASGAGTGVLRDVRVWADTISAVVLPDPVDT